MQCDPDCDPPPQPPSITGTLNCSAWGANSWCIGDETLDLSASDPQGESLLISGDRNGEIFSCGQGVTSCSIPLPEGTGTVNYKATSMLGLSDSGSTNWMRDLTPPVIDGSLSGTSGTNGWFISNVTLSAAATDTLSGVNTLEVSANGGSWENYAVPLPFGEGHHQAQFRARDNAGNESLSELVTFKIDTNPPHITLPNSWYIWESIR